MNTYENYEVQLNKLLEDESNIFFFCDLIRIKMRSDAQECKIIIDLVIEFCKKNNLDESKAWMYYYLGWYYSDLSMYNKAIELFNNCKDIFEKHDNDKGLAYAYNGLSYIYCQDGQYEISNELGLRGIAIAKEIQEDQILLTMLINTSITDIQSESYDAAKEILEYIKVNYEYSDLGHMKTILCLKAATEIEIKIGNPKKAQAYIEKAIEMDKINGVNIFTSEAY